MTEPRKPALLGLTAYFLAGLTIGITHLIAHGILGLNPVADRIGGTIPDMIRDENGTGAGIALLALLVILPLVAVAVAALMGRHGGRTAQPAAGAAAVTTLIGIPLVWVVFALASLVVGGILVAQGIDDAIDMTVLALLANGLQVLLVLGPLVALAAWVAHQGQRWAEDNETAIAGPYTREPAPAAEAPLGATDPRAWETTPEGEEEAPPPEEYEAPHADTDELVDHPVDCPRCGRSFIVSGQRPLRISCPDCGKTGKIE